MALFHGYSVITLLPLCLVVYFASSVLFTVFRRGLRTIPGPLLAIFSNFYRISLVIKGNAPQNYRRLHEEYGPIVRTGPNHVSFAAPEAIPQIYGMHSNFTKTSFYTLVTPVFHGETMETMFTTRNKETHRAIKAPVAQLYSMTNMKNYEVVADECTDLFTQAMLELEGRSIDLAVWVQWYAFDVISAISFHQRFGFLDTRSDVGDMISCIEKNLVFGAFAGQVPEAAEVLKSIFKRLFPKAHEKNPMIKMFVVAEQHVEKYDQSERDDSRTDMLAQMRARMDKIGSKRNIVNYLGNNLIAGSDTTAITLRACFYYLMRNPRAYAKLQAEIDKADDDGQLSPNITYEECLKLKYLHAVIHEAMRLHPAVGLPLEREVPEGGATVCGVVLPAGTNVAVSAPVIQYNTDVYGKDAHEFRPERWLDAESEQLKAMERCFFAFGHGSRVCIGKNISLMELGKFIPQMLRQFDVAWASPRAEWTTHTMFFSRQWDMFVTFKQRHRGGAGTTTTTTSLN